MGLLDLNWKGKSKATSSINNSITSLFSRSQPQPQPPPVISHWVDTPPHWNDADVEAPSPSLDSVNSYESENTMTSKKSFWKKKAGSGSNRVCEHKSHCDLNTAGCCACLDRRPLKKNYFVYKDGRGLVADGMRWENYCPGCKGYWGRRQGKGIPGPSSPRKEDSKDTGPSASSETPSSSLKPHQQPQQQSQTDPSDPPPPYTSSLSDGWELLPSYREEKEEYGR